MGLKDMSEFEIICAVITNMAPSMDDYLYAHDLNSDIFFISDNALERFKLKDNTFTNAKEGLGKVIHPDDGPMVMHDINAITEGRQNTHNLTYRWLGKDGNPIWINCRGLVIQTEDSGRVMLGCINEVGVKPIADNVSGLLESSAIRDILEALCEQWDDTYVLRLGIDGFKDINERFGQDYGDFVLKSVANCIQQSLLPGQQVYRMPSDEFLVLDIGKGTEEDAVQLYRRVRNALDDFIEQDNYKAIYTISGGVVTSDTLISPSYDEIMKISSFALNEAKARGRNQVYVFRPADYNRFAKEAMLRSTLRQAVENNFKGFEVVFQPIVNAETGELYAAESLLRFKNEEGVNVPPMEFIPILEETGLIIPVGKWVLAKGIELCKEVRKAVPNFRVSVNLSYVQILKSPITDEIYEQVNASGLEPDAMIMELTESGYLENTPSVLRVWEHLKDFGVRIAIDDFGTGYSNLQSIGNLCPHVVKLDRGFTLKALNDEYENRVMKHIIEMVHSIHLMICVEGIETQEELNKIRQISPDYIQGYYFGKPCNRVDFKAKFM